jgi:CheY-like chemotaxis protein
MHYAAFTVTRLGRRNAGSDLALRSLFPVGGNKNNRGTQAMTPKTTLLVEDNPQDELLTLRALRKANVPHRVDVARDGQQALDYLFRVGDYASRPGPPLPAVVVLDIGLPRLSGLEVLERLRADHRTALVPVVILTSSDDERDRLKGYQSGCNGFVRKPVDFAAFAEVVARLGVYWLATNEPPPAQ